MIDQDQVQLHFSAPLIAPPREWTARDRLLIAHGHVREGRGAVTRIAPLRGIVSVLGCRWNIGPEVLRHRRSRSTTLVQGQLSRRVHLQIVDNRVSRRIRLPLRHLQARGDLQDCPTGYRLESQKLCLIEVSRGVLLLRSVRRPSTKSPRSWRKEQDQPHRRGLRSRTRLRGVATGRRRGCGFQILIREILPDLSIGGPLNLHLKLYRVLLRRLSVLIARRKRGRSNRVPQVAVKRRILSR